MIETHLTKLRADPQYRYAVIYVYIEANLSWITARDISKIFEQPKFYPVVVKSFDTTKDARVGLWTGPAEKEQYAKELQYALGDGALCLADHFFSETSTIRTDIKAQLAVFRREVKIGANGKATVEYTGKSAGKKDDLALVLQLLLYWSRVVRNSQEYLVNSQANGWRT